MHPTRTPIVTHSPIVAMADKWAVGDPSGKSERDPSVITCAADAHSIVTACYLAPRYLMSISASLDACADGYTSEHKLAVPSRASIPLTVSVLCMMQCILCTSGP